MTKLGSNNMVSLQLGYTEMFVALKAMGNLPICRLLESTGNNPLNRDLFTYLCCITPSLSAG